MMYYMTLCIHDVYMFVAQAAQMSKVQPPVYIPHIWHDFLEYIHVFKEMTSFNEIKVIFSRNWLNIPYLITKIQIVCNELAIISPPPSQNVASSNPQAQFSGVQSCRKLLSKEKNPPINDVIG